MNHKYKIIYSLILFSILSFFTIYPHMDIIHYRLNTVIDNNAKNKQHIKQIIFNNQDNISTTIYVDSNLKQIDFALQNNRNNKPVTAILSQNNIIKTYKLNKVNNNLYRLKLFNNEFTKGRLNILLLNDTDTNLSFNINYPHIKSNHIKYNGEYIDGYSLQLYVVYKGSDFLNISIILFVIIIIIQVYLSYIAVSNNVKDNRVFYISVLLFLLICIFRFPLLTLWAEPIAETMTLYASYNLNHNYSLFDMLLLKDFSMTYLPSIINIFGRILNLDEYLIVYLQMTGIIIACIWLALFTRISLRKYLPDYVRLVLTFSLLSLWDGEAFYINSMFIYWGIYFIIYLYLIDLDKLKKYQYIFSMILLFLILSSKMSYIFLIPTAFLMIFYYGVKYKRALIMQVVIICSCLLNYITYSALMKEQSAQQSLLNYIFKLKSGFIQMLNGIGTVIHIDKIFINYTHYILILLLIILLVYIIYQFIQYKNIHNHAFILLVIITTIFMSQYIFIVSGFGMPRNMLFELGDFKFIGYGRKTYFIYIMVYVLILYIMYLVVYKNCNKKNFSIIYTLLMFTILFITIPWNFDRVSLSNFSVHTRLDTYKHLDHYKYSEFISNIENNEYIAIPSSLRAWPYIKNAKLYRFDSANSYKESPFNNPFDVIENINNINDSYDYNLISKYGGGRCMISLYTKQADILYNNLTEDKLYMKILDKDGKIITAKQINTSKYGQIGFMFNKPICNVSKIWFENNTKQIIYINSKFLIGITN